MGIIYYAVQSENLLKINYLLDIPEKLLKHKLHCPSLRYAPSKVLYLILH